MQTYTVSCLFAKQNEYLEVLKSLIEPTVRWIEITQTSDKYEKDMPDKWLHGIERSSAWFR